MHKLTITLFFIITAVSMNSINAQSMFVNRGDFAFSTGTGLVFEENYTATALNAGVSIFGYVDLSASYVTEPEAGSAYLNFHAKKDSLYGISIDIGFGTSHNKSMGIFGGTVYGKFNTTEKRNFFLYPALSMGITTTEGLLISLGFGIEFIPSDHFSIVITPGVASSTKGNSGSGTQHGVIGLELVFK